MPLSLPPVTIGNIARDDTHARHRRHAAMIPMLSRDDPHYRARSPTYWPVIISRSRAAGRKQADGCALRIDR